MVILLLSQGCSFMRNVNKNKQKSETTDKSVITEQKGSSETITEKHSRKADTVFNIPGDSVKGSKPINNLLAGQEQTIESEGSQATAKYNPKTGNLELEVKTKPRKIRINFNQEDEKTTAKIDTGSEKTQKNIFSDSSTTSKIVQSKSNNTGLILISAIILIIILILVFIYLNRKFSIIKKIFRL